MALVEAGATSAGTATATIQLNPSDTSGTTYDLTGWEAIDGDRYSKSGAFGTATLDTSTGIISYALADDRAATNALAEGEDVSDDFIVKVVDGAGLTTTKTIGFAITGRNDAPTLVVDSADSVSGSVTDQPGQTVLSTSGTLTLGDVDAAYSHTISVYPASGAWRADGDSDD